MGAEPIPQLDIEMNEI